LSRTATNERERAIWARIFYHELTHPSMWLSSSRWIARVTAALSIILVSAVVVAVSGFWTRLLYGLAFALVALHAFVWVNEMRNESRRLKEQRLLARYIWSDLT